MTDMPEAAPGHGRPTRRIDARSLRGLAHPLRMRIIERLRLYGPATSAKLSERLGESTGTISWHLRHLAEHGFIEEELGRGTRRERWWRRVPYTTVMNTAEFRDDPEVRSALSVYLHERLRQDFDRVRSYVDEEWRDEWRTVGTVSTWTDLRMTPGRLAELNAELLQVIARHSADAEAQRDPEALPVTVQLQTFPRKVRDAS